MFFLGSYIFKIRNRIKVTGKENLPRKGRVLFLSNHQTLIDSLLIGINVVSKKDLLFCQKKIPWNAPDRKNFFSHKFAKFFFGLLKNIPTDRDKRSLTDIENQIHSYCHVLKKNNLLLFFTGTRTRDGSIGKCKKGVAMTILEAKPDYIIPITLIGISDIMPVSVGFNYRKISSGHRGQMIIGEPLDFSGILSSNLFSERTKISLICELVEKSVQKNYS